jgi:hypothetical protein
MSENNLFMTFMQILTPFRDEVKSNCVALRGVFMVCSSKEDAILAYRTAYYTGGLRRIYEHS